MKLRKPNADKRHLSYSTRDIFVEYRKHYKTSNTRVDRVQWNSIIDSIIEKLKKAILVDRQVYKPRGGIGVFRMAKVPMEELKGPVYNPLTRGDAFFLKWENRYPYIKGLKNKSIYKMKQIRTFKHEVQDHVNKLANDPYQRDYNVLLA